MNVQPKLDVPWMYIVLCISIAQHAPQQYVTMHPNMCNTRSLDLGCKWYLILGTFDALNTVKGAKMQLASQDSTSHAYIKANISRQGHRNTHKPDMKQHSLLIVLLLSPSIACDKPGLSSRRHVTNHSSCKFKQLMHLTKQAYVPPPCRKLLNRSRSTPER